MDERLRLHNAVLGLAQPSPPWPQPLADAGFRIARIEQPVTTEEGRVVVDLLFVARDRNALLAVECKEGTIQEAQALCYAAMGPLDVVRTASLTLDDPSAATHDVVYAVPGDWIDETVGALPRLVPQAGVVGVDSSITWAGAAPVDPGLRAAFASPIPVDLRAIPRLLIADDASPPAAIVGSVMNQLHAVIEEGRESVTVGMLLERAFWGWPRYGRAFQGQLARKVEALLREAQTNELAGFLVVERRTRETSTPVVRFQPQVTDPVTQAGDVRAARAVRSRLDAVTARVTGRPAPPPPGQLQLVSELDADDYVEDDTE